MSSSVVNFTYCGLRRRLEALDEVAERKSNPGNHHRPGFDAAHAVDALLEREPLHDVFDVVGARLRALSVDDHRPGSRLERAGVARRILLVETELIVVVVGGDVFVRVELLGGVERALLEAGQLLGIGILRFGLGRAREQSTDGARRRDGERGVPGNFEKLAPADIEVPRSDLRLADIGSVLDEHTVTFCQLNVRDGSS